MHPLTTWLAEGPEPDAVVLWRRDTARLRPVTRRAFEASVAALVAELDPHPRGRWLLCGEDSHAFAVGLFALWHTGQVAVLPPNVQPATLGALAREGDGLVGVVSERASQLPGVPHLTPVLDSSLEAEGQGARPADRFAALDRESECAVLYTSGTTGGGRSVTKRLRHFDDEIEQLEASWGAELRGAHVVATAAHQHLYGLLFRVLWPLASGRAFDAETLLHGEEIVARMRASERVVLISVPAHLKRTGLQPGLADVRDRLVGLFSSGGPLHPDVADRWRAVTGRAPVEIYGSTESGGVAWRQRAPGEEPAPYTALPSVALRRTEASGQLQVQSPFVSAGGPEGFTLGDRVELLPDGRFVLLGRGDRVIKVGEKRLFLPDMEAGLAAHPFVAEAALLPLDQAGEQRVAAVVVPSEAGLAVLKQEGRRELGRSLVAHLAERWDRVLVPRAFRYVEALPVDARGKSPVSLLARLFDPLAEGGTSARKPAVDPGSPADPEVQEEVRGQDFCERRCVVPHGLRFFDGHFPDLPIVPGVVQVGWAVAVLDDLVAGDLGLSARPVQVARVEALKFREVMGPGVSFSIRVERPGRGERATFRLWAGDSEFSSGRFVLSADPSSDALEGGAP